MATSAGLLAIALSIAEPPAQDARSYWNEWAAARKYRFAATKDERVLLLLPVERRHPERTLDLVERALARVDALAPAASDPPVAPPAPALPAATKVPAAWGASDRALDEGTIVIGLFRDPGDYSEALLHLAKSFDYLKTWVEQGRDDPGCILERPLFGACAESVPGMEEWSPDHELVHRAAQLAMLRRFGQQPVWVALGLGWNVEFDVLRSIYCFPWRRGFVGVGEHGGFEGLLRRAFTTRPKQPLTIEELAACRRGSFEPEQAAFAWGTIRFVAEHHPAALAPLLRELHERRETLGRVPAGGRNWVMAADFELSAAEQKLVLDRIVAPDLLAQASAWFVLGKRWRKPAARGSG